MVCTIFTFKLFFLLKGNKLKLLHECPQKSDVITLQTNGMELSCWFAFQVLLFLLLFGLKCVTADIKLTNCSSTHKCYKLTQKLCCIVLIQCQTINWNILFTLFLVSRKCGTELAHSFLIHKCSSKILHTCSTDIIAVSTRSFGFVLWFVKGILWISLFGTVI